MRANTETAGLTSTSHDINACTGRGLMLVVRGLPGSGKSTVISQVMNCPEFSTALRLNPDLVNSTLPPSTFRDHMIYRDLLKQAVNSLPRGCLVIWEQPWRSLRGFLITIENVAVRAYDLPNADKSTPFSVGIMEIAVSEEIAKQRVESRFHKGEHRLTGEDFETKFRGALEPFDDLGFPFLRMDGTQPVDALVVKAGAFIRSIGTKFT